MTRWLLLVAAVALLLAGCGGAAGEVRSGWHLVSGESGHFYGYNWTGSTWQYDSAIVSGLTTPYGSHGDYNIEVFYSVCET